MMRQLTSLDAQFLAIEDGRAHGHVSGLAIYGSPLDDVLRLVGAKRLVIAGVATHSVVESTVRHAVDMGYTVTVAADACAAAQAAEHEASLHSMSLIATIARGDVPEPIRRAIERVVDLASR